MKEIIKAKHICTPDGIIDGYLVVEDKKIIEITTKELEATRDYGDKYIIPGIFDTHNHASGGYSVYGDKESRNLIENRNECTEKYLKVLASLGVTSVFPTLFATVVAQEEKDVISSCKNYIGKDVDGAKALGINFEGPFLNRTGEGDPRYVPDPINLDDIQEFIDISDYTIAEMGLAPELPQGKEAIELLLKNGVVPAMAHTDSKSKEAFEAFDNGITVATHTCNVMTGIHHRNIGALGASLMDDRVYCELICDGLHVCNDMLKLVLRLKDHNKVMLISDSSRFVGFPSGHYDLGDHTVHLDEEGRVLVGTALNGSSKGVIFGVRNLVRNCGIDLLDALHMACRVPCLKYGFNDKGSLEVGNYADYVVIDDDFNVYETYVEGRKVYDSNIDKMVLNPSVLEKKYQ
ncbi:MAG: N-acetylglucosamine-6-phosphate deacetylase [Erysipelotrichaceae bacterium]|nr:N-acetylglucosamine-6-phosphate deacetylase [Erysipelotrichaceae bacterium]